ncbi:DUF1566 domain-containing protein [Trichlorobacter lovleyi]|uniref:Lcl C-terminal domain-containing protein n=1 Tax=Trichlorobacter lovleyi TaxID=313985 RepID=UPI0024812578|nr:DUF1566 domain-containing protein [Trichlorobacter lovleyi]
MNEYINKKTNKKTPLLLAALSLLGLLLMSASAWADRYSYSTDGSQVIDSTTGLTWQRCVAGMSWSGTTCAGTAATYSHEAALAYAKTQTGWKLPNIKELASIVDRTRSNPAIDTTAFPATPADRTWSASPYAGTSVSAWVVGFNEGYVGVNLRDNTFYVRLVRAGQ